MHVVFLKHEIIIAEVELLTYIKFLQRMSWRLLILSKSFVHYIYFYISKYFK